jgi:hypothetical protein
LPRILGPRVRRLCAGALGLLLVGTLTPMVFAGAAAGAGTKYKYPQIRHIFVIVLENQSYGGTFGSPGADPYLARTLPSLGALLTNYYATGHESNDNYVSMVSGQPPNVENQADCQDFSNFIGPVANGIEEGVGCVYPASIQNIGTQLTHIGLNWKAYEEDMGNVASRESAACGHPALGGVDHTQGAVKGDGYATRHNPFVYFHSVIDNRTYCDAHVVALGSPTGVMPKSAIKGETGLATDLRSVATTPNYSFITPNLCDDGHDYPCTNQPSGPSALFDIDKFLSTWVPMIMSSPAYKQNGLIEITFDESDGPQADSGSCCGELPGLGSPLPGITGLGGGRIGAVLISPYIRGGTKVSTPFNHYSSLASFEGIFGLPRLGDAATVNSTFGAAVFNRSPAA